MEFTVLAVPDCPNVALLVRRLAIAAAGLIDVTVTRNVIGDEGQAAALGMRGSPTLLIDRSDPFAAPGQPTGLGCRLYRQVDGSLQGAPPVDSLRRALEHRMIEHRVIDHRVIKHSVPAAPPERPTDRIRNADRTTGQHGQRSRPAPSDVPHAKPLGYATADDDDQQCI
jgi:hypothetical protein